MRLKGTTILLLPFVVVVTVTMCFELVERGYLDFMGLALLGFVLIDMLTREGVLKLNDLHKAFLFMLFLLLDVYSLLQFPYRQERIIIACSMVPLIGYYIYRFFKSRRSIS